MVTPENWNGDLRETHRLSHNNLILQCFFGFEGNPAMCQNSEKWEKETLFSWIF